MQLYAAASLDNCRRSDGWMDDKSWNVETEPGGGEAEFPATFVCILMRTHLTSKQMLVRCVHVFTSTCCCHLYSLVVHHDGRPAKIQGQHHMFC